MSDSRDASSAPNGKTTNEQRPSSRQERSDFIREMIRRDLREGKYEGVVTRFPPEPNGYLHIGHAKSIVLNFGAAAEFGGRCHLRFDDTNPETEEEEYAQSIIRDIRWLGYDWGEHLYYASDYFEGFYLFAVELVEKGLAYVDSQTEEQIRESRGTITEPGRDSPFRERSVAENLDLLERMKAGEFLNGTHVLRAKIDMAAPNMKMRDPLLYRIRNVAHYRTADTWHIYPMYDFAHCLEDAIERISHSLCTLEFENNRDIYDWVLENVSIPRPRPFQTEFARLSLTYTVMSKRKLLALVKNGHVSGWDDPRMPTLAGMRRRGYTPQAIRAFCEDVGVAKANATVEVERLEHAVRDDLNKRAPRMMGVLRPLKMVVESWPEGEVEWIDAPLWPHDVPREGTRRLPFSRELYIEQEDFEKSPPHGYRRLSPGAEVRLRHACVVRCTGVVEDEEGRVVEVRVTHDPSSSEGSEGGRKKVKGTIHWVSAMHYVSLPTRLYGRLFREPFPEADPDRAFEEYLDSSSLEELRALCEPEVSRLSGGAHLQLERQGYFFVDPVDFGGGKLVLNRTVPLRDSWAKVSARTSERSDAGVAKKEPSESRPVASKKREGTRGEVRSSAANVAAVEGEVSRLRAAYALREDEGQALAARPELARFFELALASGAGPSTTARWVLNDLLALSKGRTLEGLPFGPAAFGELVRIVETGEISSSAGKTVLQEMASSGEAAGEVVERMNLRLEDAEGDLDAVAVSVLDAFPEEVQRYLEGKRGLIGFFVGKVMEQAGRGLDAREVRAAVQRHLEAAGTGPE